MVGFTAKEWGAAVKLKCVSSPTCSWGHAELGEATLAAWSLALCTQS